MKEQIKYILITALIFFVVIFTISINFYRLIYVKDSIQSFFINSIDDLIFKKTSVTIIKPGVEKKYINPYANKPDNFIHAGPFLIYRTTEKTHVRDIAKKTIQLTTFLQFNNLIREIKKINSLSGDYIDSGHSILIPSPVPSYIVDMKKEKKGGIIFTRGLYFTGSSMGNGEILQNLEKMKDLGLNTIVFDVKDITGIVTYYSAVDDVITLNTHEKRNIDNLPEFIRLVKEKGFYVIARIAVFRDHLLVQARPEFAIHSRRTGGIWNAGDKEIWCDPTSRKVQDYNIKLAIEVASMGVDEIQYDYIRFPTVGNLNDAAYRYDFGKMSKKNAITQFLKRAHEEISKKNALLSIDIFGVVAWGKAVDITKTGQEIDLLSQHCDIISPMLYPSHFNDDFDGYQNPGDNPYYFIYQGCQRVMELSNKKAVVRPWLQAFRWRVSSFNSSYILKQVKAAVDSGAYGYLFWNASNNYREVYEAFKTLKERKNPAVQR